jgi:hypothetical protein
MQAAPSPDVAGIRVTDPEHRVIHIECPSCGTSFSLIAIDLIARSEGGEQYAAAEARQLD